MRPVRVGVVLAESSSRVRRSSTVHSSGIMRSEIDRRHGAAAGVANSHFAWVGGPDGRCPRIVRDGDRQTSECDRDRAYVVGDCPPSGQGRPVTSVTRREFETLLQLACLHYLTSIELAGVLFEDVAVTANARSDGSLRALAGLAARTAV